MKQYFRVQRDAWKKRQERKKAIKEQTKHIHTLTLREIIAQYLQSRLPVRKQPVQDDNVSIMPSGKVNHIAIILDGRVEDVIRAQNRMTALLLSEPQFVEFDPKTTYPILGVTEYVDGKFVNPGQEDAAPPVQHHLHDQEVPELDPELQAFNLDDFLSLEERESIGILQKEQKD